MTQTGDTGAQLVRCQVNISLRTGFYRLGMNTMIVRNFTEKGPISGVETKKELSPEQREELLRALKARFEKNMNRHKGLEWAKVQAKLEANTEKLWSLNEMERTGGEPDVVGHDKKTGEYIFYDCSAESPKGRRSVCYDREALESRKEHKPENNAIDMAAAMGIELLTEEQYRELQKLGNFDTKTSSWVKTPSDIRKLGGALFCDRRYDTCLRVSQRCGILLCRQGVPWLAKGLNLDFDFCSLLSFEGTFERWLDCYYLVN